MTLLTGKRVLVTGGAKRVGAAISRQMASEPNTDLLLSDISQAALDATVAGLGATAAAVGTTLADVSDEAQVQAVIDLAVERYGRVDVLISNAGVLSPKLIAATA